MSCVYTMKPKGCSTLDFVRNNWTTKENVVLDVARVNFREVYFAVMNLKNKEITCKMLYLYFFPSQRYNLAYYEYDESNWDNDFIQCPKRILNLLTPTNDENSKMWRDSNLETIKLRELSKLTNKKVITFKTPHQFTNGNVYYSFYCEGKKICGGYLLENGLFIESAPVNFNLYGHMLKYEYKLSEYKTEELKMAS
jgi:hypothetical protein